MRSRLIVNILSLLVATTALSAPVLAASESANAEDYVKTDIPPGILVFDHELEGPVFTTKDGHTLYRWPQKHLRNGDAGEIEGKPTCDDTVYKENAGLMSPYPPGLTLPEAEKRVSCTNLYPPFLAPEGAKAMGKWSVVDRPDGRKQWAYKGFALYTSSMDKNPGDALAGSDLDSGSETGATRVPVGPDPNVPPQFAVMTTMRGRMITTREGWSVYAYDKDARNKSNCTGVCLDGWQPVSAPAYSRPVGEWTIIERSPGVTQWAFRGKPVYRHLTDRKLHSMDGSDIAGWQNVYTQTGPKPPAEFAVKDTLIGLVLGDKNGKTLYRYRCSDDALDQQLCDYPEAPQAYRFAICGGGDVDRCLKTFPYVVAAPGAKSGNKTWTTMDINPRTGKVAAAGEAGALHVWAYRGRPVYTFAGDKKSADILAHAWGEFNGLRNGFMAITYRDVFSRRDE